MQNSKSLLLTIDRHSGNKGITVRKLKSICSPEFSCVATLEAVLHFVALGHLRIVKTAAQVDAIEFTDAGHTELTAQKIGF